MKKILAAGIAAAAFCSAPAFAADMPVKAPPAPIFTWTGFYLGVDGGYGWGSSDPTALSFQEFFPAGVLVSSGTFGPGLQNKGRLSGGFGGGTAGYNWQSGAIVFGLEGDINAASITGTSDCSTTYGGIFGPAPGTSICHNKLTFLATAAGRLGWAVDHALFYVKGGGAWGNFQHDAAGQVTNPTGPWLASTRDDRAGYTIGGGIEYAFWGNWSAKVEYDYMGFGTKNLNMAFQKPANATFVINVNDRETVQVIKVGLNYRFAWGGGH
jgi:outer membrane immunogenic protein